MGWLVVAEREDAEDMEGEGGFGGRVEIVCRWALLNKWVVKNE